MLYLVVYLIVGFLFCFILYKIHKYFWNKVEKTEKDFNYRSIIFSFFVGILFMGICFIGARGRVEIKSPIRIGTAYFSNNAFLNQLGLNPNFVLLNTMLELKKDKSKEIKFIDNRQAIQNVRQYLNIISEDPISPIARIIPAKDTVRKKNVVLILMESMSSNHLRADSAETNVPFLKHLLTKSTYFPNFYSAGVHTFNGILWLAVCFTGLQMVNRRAELRRAPST